MRTDRPRGLILALICSIALASSVAVPQAHAGILSYLKQEIFGRAPAHRKKHTSKSSRRVAQRRTLAAKRTASSSRGPIVAARPRPAVLRSSSNRPVIAVHLATAPPVNRLIAKSPASKSATAFVPPITPGHRRIITHDLEAAPSSFGPVIGASDYRLLKDQTWTSPAPLAADAPLPQLKDLRAPQASNDLAFSTRASWYGPGFQGRRTASGVAFNQYGLTAASRTLPLGSKVLVANPTTGRCCTVLINDRGPYVNGRDIDLSRGAAAKIGVTGVSPVVCVAYSKGSGTGKASSRSASHRQSKRYKQRLSSERSKYTTIGPPEQINDRPMRLMAGIL